MDLDKLRGALAQMHPEILSSGGTLIFEIISGSMRPLLRPRDMIVVAGKPPAGLRPGDIALIRTGQNDTPVAHRIIALRNDAAGTMALTRGDNNPFPDRNWIPEGSIIGIAIAIRRRGLPFQLDLRLPMVRSLTLWAMHAARVKFHLSSLRDCVSDPSIGPKTLSGTEHDLMRGTLYRAIVYSLRSLKKAIHALWPEPKCRPAAPAWACARAAVLFDADEWSVCRGKFEEWFGDFSGTAADLDIGGGLSEEALTLVRRGAEIALLPVQGPAPEGTYDLVIAGRGIDCGDPRHAARRLAKMMTAMLKPGGQIFAVWRDRPAVSSRNRLKRTFWRAVSAGSYRGPRGNESLVTGPGYSFALPERRADEVFSEEGLKRVRQSRMKGIVIEAWQRSGDHSA